MQLLELLMKLRPGGKASEASDRYMMSCPFHRDGNPSFGVRLSSGYGKCFSCGAEADLPTILMKLTGAKSRMAAMRQAKGLVLDGVVEDAPVKAKPAVVRLLETSGPDFWLGRGLTLGDIHLFGFDTGWVEDASHVRRPVATMPIRDHKGRLMGVCSRRTDADVPKSLRYSYSTGMAKAECLWGVHLLKPPIDAVYLAEGIIKAAVMRSQGYEALSPLGARVSRVQNKLARKYADEIIWVADNDAAGVEAADFHAKTYGYSIALVSSDDVKDVDEQYVKHGEIKLDIVTARQWLREKERG